jgi:hypothetical protein
MNKSIVCYLTDRDVEFVDMVFNTSCIIIFEVDFVLFLLLFPFSFLREKVLLLRRGRLATLQSYCIMTEKCAKIPRRPSRLGGLELRLVFGRPSSDRLATITGIKPLV